MTTMIGLISGLNAGSQCALDSWANNSNKPTYIVLTNGVIKDQNGSNYPVKDSEIFTDSWNYV